MQEQNRAVGMIPSAKYLRIAEYPKFGEPDDPYHHFIPDPNFKGVISLFQIGITKQYQIEYNLEVARRTLYPQFPSRFSAIFVFDDIEQARKADERHHWSRYSDLVKVKPIHPEILCTYSRHDMEMVSMARGEWSIVGEDLDRMVRGYWEGLECKGVEYRGVLHTSDPIWEVLFDGALAFAR
ncbi:hypothetical protein HY346_00500 [Candidatus Microgenomates bacterium]|nr:hypothetical protein [Candidatus Microgenomates bacterium]